MFALCQLFSPMDCHLNVMRGGWRKFSMILRALPSVVFEVTPLRVTHSGKVEGEKRME